MHNAVQERILELIYERNAGESGEVMIIIFQVCANQPGEIEFSYTCILLRKKKKITFDISFLAWELIREEVS